MQNRLHDGAVIVHLEAVLTDLAVEGRLGNGAGVLTQIEHPAQAFV